MKYVQVVFSPTGGTKKVADILSKAWNCVETIDLSDSTINFSKYEFSKDDLVLVAMPSFGGLAPHVAIDRLKQMSGNEAKCVLVAVYGNRAYEDTLVQMQDALEACHFNPIAAIAAIAQHSIMPQYASGRPNKEDEKQLLSFVDCINEKYLKKEMTKLNLPGNRPYKKVGEATLIPKSSDACDNCGLCAKLCPLQAIDVNNYQVDKNKCIACMRCVSACPKKARKVNKALVSVAALAIKKACSIKKDNELFI